METFSSSQIRTLLSLHQPKPEGEYRRCSVMLLLFQQNGQLELLFTKRAMHLTYQPGDICFPGGRAERGETPLQTAYREIEEEVGLRKEDLSLLGQIDYIVTYVGTIITPFVALVDKAISPSDLNVNPEEIGEIFTVPLSYFFQTTPKKSYLRYEHVLDKDFPVDFIRNGKNYPFAKPKLVHYFYSYGPYVIWGITARMARNFVQILQQKL